MRTNHLEDANKLFLKGARDGMRATDQLYDMMIEEDCKAGDHSNVEMEAAGYMWIPKVAYATFENMEYGQDFVKPDTETYNWVIQAYTRAESYMIGNSYEEAIRHFRVLKKFEGGTIVFLNAGNFEDPLSLYLRALCREGRIVDLIDDAMRKDNQSIPPRAMIMSRKYRTLVHRFIYSNPIETSIKQRCLEDWKIHHRRLLRTLQSEGLPVLGDASESDYMRVIERLRNIIRGPAQNLLKPKAASKMVVSELKEELEAQGLPNDGTRNFLYERVQKARRINKSRGRPLWVPPIEEEEEEVADELICRIKLHEGDTEFWKRRFLGEGLIRTSVESNETAETVATVESENKIKDVAKEVDDDEEEEEQEGDDENEEEEVVVAETERSSRRRGFS
ncbi:PREDICTED: uncharacterized protein LOC109132414 [Camelina sativa]|uniref:Uncharacterized protein LOC109132414 n=1 Tax=Camelina sativa TaxID=90675 RepID=A0ABM1RKM8_CAMSA|nr:PREDICTED: uncharacterized protein LOC109132414 [Camelina sativa]